MKTYFLTACLLCATVAGRAETRAAFEGDCERLLLSSIHAAQKEIHGAIYEFTKKSIADALIERAGRGVKVALKVDAHEAESTYSAEVMERLAKAKITVQRIEMPHEVKMHHKFLVIDGRLVLTGSYNWTKHASDANWENLVAIESPALAEEFRAEWDRIHTVSGKHN
jgi:phosphatidylserine/phosphatidylglycerophosphate/cardiolipin synthase-like enzyme